MTKILLVEDDKSLREIYGVRLLAEGYDIVSAGDGEEALAMAIKDRPDLILSDVMMPKISGFDMLDILRSTTETKGIKVIMMTALSSEEQRQRGVALGADRYLVKSQVGIEDVVRTVHEVLADSPVSAPVVAPAPTLTTPMPSPAMAASVAPQMATPIPVSVPIPVSAPTAAPVPAPALTTPMPSPAMAAPVAPQMATSIPVSVPTSAPILTAPAAAPLPSPTAPLTTLVPKQTLASRVIEPLPTHAGPSPDFGNLMSQELSSAAPRPPTPQPPVRPDIASAITPPTAPQGTPPYLHFEETPRPPAAPSVTSPAPIGVEPTPGA